MTERSWFWDGSTGDGGTYGDNSFMDRYFRMLFDGTGNRGVLRNWLNGLAVTDGGANTATVATGGSIIYGLFHENDAALNVTVPNGPRTDLIVVRRSWAAQTARITRIAGPGAALTQTPNVTYDIPLAEVDVDGAGALTITDTREWCTFPFEPADDSVPAAALATDAVTTAILENQTRWRVHGAGMLKPDDSNPPSWTMGSGDPVSYVAYLPYWYPMNCAWRMDPGGNDGVWLTERVPEDFTGTTVSIYVWNTPDISGNATDLPGWQIPWAMTGSVVWDAVAWAGASGAAFASQSATATVDNAGRTDSDKYAEGSPYMYRDLIGTVTVSAGDLLHIEVHRDGANGADTMVAYSKLMAVELAYTADS